MPAPLVLLSSQEIILLQQVDKNRHCLQMEGREHERKGSNNKGADAGFQRGGRRRGLQQQPCAVNVAAQPDSCLLGPASGHYKGVTGAHCLCCSAPRGSFPGRHSKGFLYAVIMCPLPVLLLSENYHAPYPRLWKQTKTHKDAVSFFRCLHLSLLHKPSHATKWYSSHLKGFQFINSQRSHLHRAYGYSHEEAEDSPTLFPPNALCSKTEVTVFLNCISTLHDICHSTSFLKLHILASSYLSTPYLTARKYLVRSFLEFSHHNQTWTLWKGGSTF